MRRVMPWKPAGLLSSAEISSPSDHGLFKQSYTELYRILYNHGHMFELSGELREIRTRRQDFLNSLSHRPLPVLTENYQISLGILGAAQQLGLCVPKDLDIVCFDELPEETLPPWPVPMIRIFHGKKASIAAKQLIDRIEGRTDINISYSFRTELINHSIGDKP